VSVVPVGAGEHTPGPGRVFGLHSSFLLLVAVALGAIGAACSTDDVSPKTLMDGSGASAPPVEIEGVSTPAVLTKVRVVAVAAIEPGSLAAKCLRGRARDAHPTGRVVERIGVASATVTLRDMSGLHGCDDSPGRREEDRRWCGSSFGRLYGGHLRDPRLDIAGCSTADGRPMGFAWVEVTRGARYLVVEQPGYAEVYEAAAGLPVRISTTTGVRVEGSRASFDISEHDAHGRLLRRYQLTAVPTG